MTSAWLPLGRCSAVPWPASRTPREVLHCHARIAVLCPHAPFFPVSDCLCLRRVPTPSRTWTTSPLLYRYLRPLYNGAPAVGEERAAGDQLRRAPRRPRVGGGRRQRVAPGEGDSRQGMWAAHCCVVMCCDLVWSVSWAWWLGRPCWCFPLLVHPAVEARLTVCWRFWYAACWGEILWLAFS